MSTPERLATIAARYLAQLHTRQENAMTTTAPHILVITGSAEDCTRDYQIECPGVTDACRMYADCLAPDGEQAALERAVGDGLPAIAHGKRHLKIDGTWMAETDQCFVSTADSMPDSADDLAARERLVNGRYPIDFDYQGEGWYELQLLTPVVAA